MRTEARCGCTVIPRSAPKRRKGSPDASPSASRASCGSSTRGCRGPAPARGSTPSGSASGGSRSAAAVPDSITPWTSSPTPTAPRQWPSPGAQAPCRHHAHPSGCLLSTLQCPRLGSADLVAHRSRSRVPLSQVRTRPPRRPGPTIRRRLAEHGENASWTTLRRILQGQHRVTASFRRKDGRTLHVRKATRAEQPQLKICDRSRSRCRPRRSGIITTFKIPC